MKLIQIPRGKLRTFLNILKKDVLVLSPLLNSPLPLCAIMAHFKVSNIYLQEMEGHGSVGQNHTLEQLISDFCWLLSLNLRIEFFTQLHHLQSCASKSIFNTEEILKYMLFKVIV